MKRIAFLMLFLLTIGQLEEAKAQTGSNVQYNFYYQSFRDEYRLDYWGYPSGVAGIHLHFVAAVNGSVYERDYGTDALRSGIFYLTCNGVYNYYLLSSSGAELASIENLVTSSIVGDRCNSYPDGGSTNDMNARARNNQITWNDVPGATGYEIYKDGQLVGTTNGSPYTVDGDGSYTVRAVDGNGNTVGQSDLKIDNGSSSGGGNASDCGVCDKLNELLNCPGWNDYLGDITQAIKDALPPPPDWDSIADKIGSATIRHLSDYLGDVPDAPYPSLDVQLPTVDNSVPEATNLEPQVPPGYETPIPFDITSGPQIEIQDNSSPFTILDPLHDMEYDNPGVPVIPGDPRNNSGGIKQPDTIEGTLPTPNVPDNENFEPVPTPNVNNGPPPTPQPVPSPIGGDQVIPIPTDPGGIIPTPRG